MRKAAVGYVTDATREARKALARMKYHQNHVQDPAAYCFEPQTNRYIQRRPGPMITIVL